MLWSLLFLFSNSSAFASFHLASCGNFPAFSKIFVEDGVTCATVTDLGSELVSIQAFAGPSAPIKLFVENRAYDSFSTFSGLLKLNQVQMAWGEPRPAVQNEVIRAHEIGHTYFASWLQRDFAGIRGFYDYMRSSDDLQVAFANPHLDTSARLASRWRAEYGLARDLQTPFSELFADLVSVLRFDDAMAMTQAMLSPGMPDSARGEAQYFGFRGDYDLKNWNASDPHDLLAPSRGFIGRRFLKFPLENSRKNWILHKVYLASLHEIEKYWSGTRQLPSAADANRDFMAELGAPSSNPPAPTKSAGN